MKLPFRRSKKSAHPSAELEETSVANGEEAFNGFIEFMKQVAKSASGIATSTRVLGLLSLLSAVWLWYYLFRGVLIDGSWLVIPSFILVVVLVAPSYFVFRLYTILNRTIALPGDLIAMKDDIILHHGGALEQFRNRNVVGYTKGSWQLVSFLRQLYELVTLVPNLLRDYLDVAALANPLYLAILAVSALLCIFTNALALLTFVLWIF